MPPRVALRPINTSLIDPDLGTHTFRSVDSDLIARRVFEKIGTSAEIAANFVEGLAAWTGEPGTAGEFARAKQELTAKLSQSLSAAYEDDVPVRAYPSPPVVTVKSDPAPLPENPTVEDARRWILTWNTEPERPSDIIRTALSTEPVVVATVDASPFERALLACEVDLNDATLGQLASTPIDPPKTNKSSVPNGPASGSMSFDAGQAMGVRATVIRNEGFPPPFVYVVSALSEVLNPFIERDDVIAIANLAELETLSPTGIAVSYEHSDPPERVPVLLVNGPFDADTLGRAVEDWKETQQPPEGQFVFDVTADHLRLRRVVIG